MLFIIIIFLLHSPRKIQSCYSVASQLGRPTIVHLTRLDSMDDRGTQKCYEKLYCLGLAESRKVRVDTTWQSWTRLVCPQVFLPLNAEIHIYNERRCGILDDGVSQLGTK
jgi:hypothetical protein